MRANQQWFRPLLFWSGANSWNNKQQFFKVQNALTLVTKNPALLFTNARL
jgi:hypothetical protein